MNMHAKTIKVRIPLYINPRNIWRQLLHEEILKASVKRGISYRQSDKLELDVVLYLNEKQLGFHDLDNRLKDIMDALQGRAGGSKAKRTLVPIIPNDRQIYRVTVEKKSPPKQSHGLGHLTIKRYEDKKR